jgi:hypothetical protein
MARNVHNSAEALETSTPAVAVGQNVLITLVRVAPCIHDAVQAVPRAFLLSAACLPWQAADSHCAPTRKPCRGQFQISEFSKSDAPAHAGLQQQLEIIHIYEFVSRPLEKIFFFRPLRFGRGGRKGGARHYSY